MIFLAQSDTTAGFLGFCPSRINSLKARPTNKPILLEVHSLSQIASRVPQIHKNIVRRSKNKTFIYPNKKSFRVIREPNHARFLQCFGSMYSSSANFANQKFDYDFAFDSVDVVVGDRRGFYEGKASEIYKINTRSIKRIR